MDRDGPNIVSLRIVEDTSGDILGHAANCLRTSCPRAMISGREHMRMSSESLARKFWRGDGWPIGMKLGIGNLAD